MLRTSGRLLGAALVAGTCLAATCLAGAGAAQARADATVTASLGASRAVPPGYFGINYDYGGAAVYAKDRSVAQQIAALAPGTLRWPAGTGANYFQWQNGYPVADPAAGAKGSCAPPAESQTDGFQFTLGDLAAAVRAARGTATPVFDLNVMTASLASQIDMLRTAQDRYGLPVRYVELGNEFYLCNADYVAAFPTAQDYGTTVAADVKALHRAFPGVRVAAVGAVPSVSSGRTQGWTSGLLSVATGAGKPDAITLHDHPEFNQTLTAAGLPALFAIPYSSAENVATATRQFPGTPAWITEYGLSLHFGGANAPQLTYANALFESEAAILLAQQVSAATLINYWSAFGPSLNYAYTASGLTPAGLAMQWLDQAARGATREAPVVFSGGPVLGATGDPALVGESFRSGFAGGQSTMLINLSGSTVTIGAAAFGGGYRQVSGDPTREIGTASGLSTTSGYADRTITLAPYSMTVIKG